jgi:hypothetical protein
MLHLCQKHHRGETICLQLSRQAITSLQIRNIADSNDKSAVDPCGHPLPPCIVMERGESLDLWSDRAKPDRSQAFSVCNHIMLGAVEDSAYVCCARVLHSCKHFYIDNGLTLGSFCHTSLWTCISRWLTSAS